MLVIIDAVRLGESEVCGEDLPLRLIFHENFPLRVVADDPGRDVPAQVESLRAELSHSDERAEPCWLGERVSMNLLPLVCRLRRGSAEKKGIQIGLA